MGEPRKKSFSLFKSKSSASRNYREDDSNKSISTRMPAPVVMRSNSTKPSNREDRKRTSISALGDLVQCPLCMEKFNNPKMLPCQHTFCQSCLHGQIKDANLICLICNNKYPVTAENFIESLPSNLYIDNLLAIFGISKPQTDQTSLPSVSTNSKVYQKRCCQCQSMVELMMEYCCEHCKQTFCGVCWSKHISELKTQIGSLCSQLVLGSERLTHRMESFQDQSDWLVHQINSTTEEKINDLNDNKNKLLAEANEILTNRKTSAESLNNLIKSMHSKIEAYVKKDFDITVDDNEKILAFMNFHRHAVELLNDVSHWGEKKYSFDREKFCIEDSSQTLEAEADEPLAVEIKGIQNPLEDINSLAVYYRSRNFLPRLILKKCSRPAGVGVAPWSDNLYVCSTDAHNIIVMDRVKGKVIERFSDPNMLCPHGIAFAAKREEIFISDKWKHCIHVFSRAGVYLRSFGSKGDKEGCFRSPEGIAIEPNEKHLYICDTGNDKIQVFDVDTGAFIRYVGLYRKPDSNTYYTHLNAPSAIAATAKCIVVADSGSRRIKIFSYFGDKIKEIGSPGTLKGQFMHPEALVVDPLGFILVGDSGNARVQIFDPNGSLVRVFGGKGHEAGKFGWISGMHITPQLELIVCDTKNHQINVF